MQVDTALHSQYSLNSAFEDFFHIELFGNQHSSPASVQTSTGRSSSSNSPDSGLSALPPTPPPDPDPFFTFYSEDDLALAKSDPLISYPSTSSFDFFGSNDRYSPMSQSATGTDPVDVAMPSTVLAIDPQLVGTSSTPKAAPEMDEDERYATAEPVSSTTTAVASEQHVHIPPYKVGGKGKSSRKGTVQGGGVVKKSSATKERASSSFPQSPTDDTSGNDWDDGRPPPEEYKKLSSKEKRQLRNKISARNFRVRRKEYITTLETDIAERDRLIDAIRSELGSTKSENNALRQEIDILKKSLLDAQPSPVLPPPAPLPTVSAAVSVAVRNTATPSSPLLSPNTNKDLPSSPRLASARGGFWGGQGSSPFGAMGGFTPVHTTLVPDWSISGALAGKGLVTPPDSPPFSLPQHPLQENINPALNGTNESTTKSQSGNLQSPSLFDSFTDVNPFTMKTLEMYRIQLWTRLVQQRAPQRQQKQTISQSPPLTGLAANLRPHYFAASGKQVLTSTSLSSLLSGKGVGTSYPTPPSSPPMASGTPTKVTAQDAVLASFASQTLIGKLGSVFWDAFAGQSSCSVGCSPCKSLDADKVRRVLEGKAVLRVVDVNEPLSPRTPSSSPKFVPSSPKISPQTSPNPSIRSAEVKDKCNEKIADLLESMKSLSISKRGPC